MLHLVGNIAKGICSGVST